jgi:hypothetical protein
MGFQRAIQRGEKRHHLTLAHSGREHEATDDFLYRHWLKDMDRPDKAEALRRAQNDIRGVPGYESPYHWAGFQLAGAP